MKKKKVITIEIDEQESEIWDKVLKNEWQSDDELADLVRRQMRLHVTESLIAPTIADRPKPDFHLNFEPSVYLRELYEGKHADH